VARQTPPPDWPEWQGYAPDSLEGKTRGVGGDGVTAAALPGKGAAIQWAYAGLWACLDCSAQSLRGGLCEPTGSVACMDNLLAAWVGTSWDHRVCEYATAGLQCRGWSGRAQRGAFPSSNLPPRARVGTVRCGAVCVHTVRCASQWCGAERARVLWCCGVAAVPQRRAAEQQTHRSAAERRGARSGACTVVSSG